MPPTYNPFVRLPPILRLNAGEICLACKRANSPRVDDVPFCSSCVDAGWDIAFARGANAVFAAMLEVAKPV